MLKQIISLFLVGLIINLTLYTSARANIPESKAEKEAKFTQKVKIGVEKLGIGKESQVKVKLKDGGEVKGYISQINDENFVVIDNSDQANTIPYSGVKQIKGKNNLSGEKIGTIAILAFLAVVFYVWATNENP